MLWMNDLKIVLRRDSSRFYHPEHDPLHCNLNWSLIYEVNERP
jgi:hypothetical protein